jgi:hypothetical protein
MTLSYGQITSVLTKAVQEQQKQFEGLHATIDTQQQQIEELNATIDKQQKQIEELLHIVKAGK